MSDVGRRQAEEHVGAVHRLGERALVGFDRMRRLPLVEVGAVLVDHALAVAHDDVVAAHAHRLDELGAGDRRRAGAVHHDLDVAELAIGQMAGVDQAGGGDDRGAVLVVVEDRNVHPLAQRLLDDEAVGRGNILEVDAAEARLEQFDRIDEPLRVLGLHLDVDRVDVGEALEQHRFAFHHRLGRERAEIAEAEDRGAVGDDRDEIALGSYNRRRRPGFPRSRAPEPRPRRISEAEVALRRHRLGRDDLDLARAPARVEFERFGFGIFDVAFRHGVRALAEECARVHAPTESGVD